MAHREEFSFAAWIKAEHKVAWTGSKVITKEYKSERSEAKMIGEGQTVGLARVSSKDDLLIK